MYNLSKSILVSNDFIPYYSYYVKKFLEEAATGADIAKM